MLNMFFGDQDAENKPGYCEWYNYSRDTGYSRIKETDEFLQKYRTMSLLIVEWLIFIYLFLRNKIELTKKS